MTARAPQPRRLIRATLLVACITILALLLLTRTSLFREFEAAARDAQARLLPPRESDRIVIVEIDDDDYRALFRSVSPLAPDVVRQVLRAIQAGRPRAIGIDLDTSHPIYRDVVFSADDGPVVWARDAVACVESQTQAATAPSCNPGELTPQDYLGGQEGEPFGLVAFEPDHGGTIRRYQRAIETTRGPMPSFPAAVARVMAGPNLKTDEPDTRLLSMEYRRGGPLRVASRTILEWAAEPTSDYRTHGPLRDRIVLLGGHYRAARDEHPTPLGPMSGVEILAQALETELDGHGRPAPSPAVLLILQSLAVLFLVTLFVRFSFPRAFLLSVMALPPLALLGGWMVTGVALTGFAYFLPLLIVMLIHILYEKVIEYREALMVELVGSSRSDDEPGSTHSHDAALDRLEVGLDRLVAGARSSIRRRFFGIPPGGAQREAPREAPPDDAGSARS